ncbi:MAG: hypothetical protein JXA21_11140, partial [Anaerolineae bacterium]|nr:hypothetical protein [Anaerolineae bacterium]
GGGEIAANGGGGTAGNGTNGGGGGGGRIALHVANNVFVGNVTAFGGTGYQPGGDGTIWPAQPVVVQGQVRNAYAPELPLGSTLVVLSTPGLGEWCIAFSDGDGNYSCPAVDWPAGVGDTFVFTGALSGGWGSTTQVYTVPLEGLSAIDGQIVLPYNLFGAATTFRLDGLVVDEIEQTPIYDAWITVSGDLIGEAYSDETGVFSMSWTLAPAQTELAFDVIGATWYGQVVVPVSITVQANQLNVYTATLQLESPPPGPDAPVSERLKNRK